MAAARAQPVLNVRGSTQETETPRSAGFGLAAPRLGGETRLKQLLFVALGGRPVPPGTLVKAQERQKVLRLPCFCSTRFFVFSKHLY